MGKMVEMSHDFPSLLAAIFAHELPAEFPEEAFKVWSDDMAQLDMLDASQKTELQHSIHELRDAINKLKENKKSVFDSEVFKHLEAVSKAWTQYALTQHGIDEETGLRHFSTLMKLLDNELERRARHNVPFAFVMARVDRVICNGQTMQPETRHEIRMNVAEAFKGALRSYDMAIRGKGLVFYAVLSHSTQDGGARFMARVKELMKKTPLKFAYQQHKDIELSLSYVVSEPYPGDDLNKMMAYMEKDLTAACAKATGEEVRFHEMSDLRRYVTTIEKNGKISA